MRWVRSDLGYAPPSDVGSLRPSRFVVLRGSRDQPVRPVQIAIKATKSSAAGSSHTGAC